ncbi:MAG: hypothetical protein H6731_10720 [Myxococcales bacterium]|nr:MAG: hypothetical protein H6731_10720 [Myxococcales bacterium]
MENYLIAFNYFQLDQSTCVYEKAQLLKKIAELQSVRKDIIENPNQKYQSCVPKSEL